MHGNKDWRSLPRKGRLKRDASIKIRVPKIYREAWRNEAGKENTSLSDWLFSNLKEAVPVEEIENEN